MAITAGVTYAIIQYYVDLPMSLEIVGEYNLAIWELDGTTPFTDISFGQLTPGESDYWGSFIIENTGDYSVYLSYGLTDWPLEVDLGVTLRDISLILIEILDPDTTTGTMLDPGVSWVVDIGYTVDPGAGAGSHTPVMRWNAHDTP
jgi:hypothetical protein